MRYDEFVEAVLQTVASRQQDRSRSFPYWSLAEDLGLDAGAWGNHADPIHAAKQYALVAVCFDLESTGLIHASQQDVVPSLKGRRFAHDPVSDIYPELRAGDLRADEETYLRELARQSHQPHEGWAEATYVESENVFTALGWNWDILRSSDLLRVAQQYLFAQSRIYAGGGHSARITWAGLIRVTDRPGQMLEEARAHLQRGHLRAAGVVAAVQLERRLFDLGVRPVPKRKSDPGLDDYRQAARNRPDPIIDQETYELIGALMAIRKRCAHFIEREPTVEEATQLVDGIDGILRKYPLPG
jgi:hypothetical protein